MFRIVVKALTRLGRGYSIWELPAMAARAAGGFWKPHGKARQSMAFVCSTLYSDAYVEATARSLLLEGRIEDVWPGHIAATSRMVDVPVPWVSVG